MTSPQAGGFLPSPPSTHRSTALSPTLSVSGTTLPTPRTTPLRPGGAKEAALRRYVEDRLLHISARYERRFSKHIASQEPEPDYDNRSASHLTAVAGYDTYAQAAGDLNGVLDVVWVSGTPTIQIPFFFTIALAASDYLPSFPFAPASTFRLVRALDAVFASLLAGEDVETHMPLPRGRRLTTTEKVRLHGIAETTRIRIARAAGGDGSIVDSVAGGEETETEHDDEDDELEGFGRLGPSDMMEGMEGGDARSRENPAEVEMGVARVYQRTLVALGPSLDGAETIGFSNC